MAQETRVNPIVLDNTPAQILMEMGKEADMLKKQKAQLAYEQLLRNHAESLRIKQQEEARQWQNGENFKAIIENPKFEDEITNQELPGLIDKYKNYVGSSSQYQKDLNTDLANLYQRSSLLKTIKGSINDGLTKMDNGFKTGLDVAPLKNDAIKNAILNPDGSIKSNDDLKASLNQDWLKNTYTQGRGLYRVAGTGEAMMLDLITDSKNLGEVTIGTKGQRGQNVSSSKVSVKYNPLFQTVDRKTGQVKFKYGDDGLISDDVYKTFMSNENIGVAIENKANQFVKDYNAATDDAKKALLQQRGILDANMDGIPDQFDITHLNDVQKAFLTHEIIDKTPRRESKSDSQTIVVSGQSATPPTIDAWTPLTNAIAGKGGEMKASDYNDSNTLQYLIKLANDTNPPALKRGSKKKEWSADDLTLKTESDGSISAYNNGKKVAGTVKSSFDQWANNSLGLKSKIIVEENNQKDKPLTKPSFMEWKKIPRNENKSFTEYTNS